MTRKETLANEYIELRKQFDGPDFRANAYENQISYLCKTFTITDLNDKIDAVKRAIREKANRIKNEAYLNTPEGMALKANIEAQIKTCQANYRKVHDEFESWINTEVNNLVPGGWGVNLHIGYMSGNVEIGLINRDKGNPNRKLEFGHEFNIYFDSYAYGKRAPRFDLNYGTMGSFDIFNNEIRPIYLNGLATISNNKEFLQLLLAKFIENVQNANKISEELDKLRKQLENPLNL